MSTFVYDSTEVRQTGRTAKRVLKLAGNRTKEMTLVEITPVDPSFDWKKWVDPAQLYVVESQAP